MSQIDDQLAIMQLISRYYQAIDALDFAGWAACFAPGGRFEGAFDSYDVHADLARFEADTREFERKWTNLRHQATAPVIILDGDQATADCNFMMTTVTAEMGEEPRVSVVMAGRYLDKLERTSDGWRFRVRQSAPDSAQQR